MLTPREHASGLYTAAMSMGTTIPLGVDAEEVTASRREFVNRALIAVQRALAGPERRFAVEPDDESLRAMLANIGHRHAKVLSTE
jgi:hypothetical protein